MPALHAKGLPATEPAAQQCLSSQLRKEYDKTLTKSEQKAAISDLEAAQAKARGEAGPESTGANGAKSAQTQD